MEPEPVRVCGHWQAETADKTTETADSVAVEEPPTPRVVVADIPEEVVGKTATPMAAEGAPSTPAQTHREQADSKPGTALWLSPGNPYLYTMKFWYLLCLPLLLSCGEASPLARNFKSFMTDREGLFRGFNLGDSYDAILNNEPAENRVYMDSVTLRYSFVFPQKQEFQVNYFFDNERLHEIHILAFLGTMEEGGQWFELFYDWYEKKFGKPLDEKGFMVFYGKDGITIEVYDESPLYESGVLRIWIYRENPEKQKDPPAV